MDGDAAAVALPRTGDGDAFRRVVERHSQELFRLAFRLTGNEDDAEDIVQETFLRAYRAFDRFENRAQVGTWLFRIAANCALDLLRRGRKRKPREASEDIPSPQAGPERLAMDRQLQGRIARAMAALTPQERVAFTLRHFEGQSIEEISATLKVGVSAAKQAVFRAVQKLRRALDPAQEGAP
jgi:RNA polymerase sigma-70 factor, ECF subfamily